MNVKNEALEYCDGDEDSRSMSWRWRMKLRVCVLWIGWDDYDAPICASKTRTGKNRSFSSFVTILCVVSFFHLKVCIVWFFWLGWRLRVERRREPGWRWWTGSEEDWGWSPKPMNNLLPKKILWNMMKVGTYRIFQNPLLYFLQSNLFFLFWFWVGYDLVG